MKGAKQTIDKASRILTRRKVRELAAWTSVPTFKPTNDDDPVILSPAPSPMRIEKHGRFFVVMPEPGTPPLTHRTVERCRRREWG